MPNQFHSTHWTPDHDKAAEPHPAGGELRELQESFARLDKKYGKDWVEWQDVRDALSAFAASERGQECKCGPNVAGQPLIVKTFCSVCSGEVHE